MMNEQSVRLFKRVKRLEILFRKRVVKKTQHTLQNPVELQGVGLHTGTEAKLRLLLRLVVRHNSLLTGGTLSQSFFDHLRLHLIGPANGKEKGSV